jgi:flagellar biosynthesis component FlhA
VKIELNVGELFVSANENGITLDKAMRNSIVNAVAERISLGSEAQQIVTEGREQVKKIISEKVSARIAELIEIHLDTEFEEVTSWGEKKKQSSVRALIANEFKNACVLNSSSYGTKNPFTRAVESAVQSCMESYRKQFDTEVSKQLLAQAMQYAADSLKKKLQL